MQLLHFKKDHYIPFQKELVHVENYLFIEKLRFGKRLEVECEIQTEDASGYLIKPPSRAEIQNELNKLRYPVKQPKKCKENWKINSLQEHLWK